MDHPIEFDSNYIKEPGIAPAGPIDWKQPLSQESISTLVSSHLTAQIQTILRSPRGSLQHPYLVPGGQYDELWDWDAYFVALAMPDAYLPYAQGSIVNLLSGVREDGRPPKQATPQGTFNYRGFPLPVHAQFVLLAAERMNDFSWVEPLWPDLMKIRSWYNHETLVRDSYYVWISHRGCGIDNNPAVYGRPCYSSAGVDLAVWHRRECAALARLAEKLGEDPAAAEWSEKAAAARADIQTRFWDRIDQFFYSIDVLRNETVTAKQGVTWETFLKFRNWASLFPLWDASASEKQAEALITKILAPEEFGSPWGVRTHSAIDPLYNNTLMGDPSNWQGPIWGLSSFLIAHGLANYGQTAAAEKIWNQQLRLWAMDIRQNGAIHEYYNAETGQPVLRPDFLSWNLLGLQSPTETLCGFDLK